MKDELVSIITLCYNNSQYYRECLSSILNQTYKKIELLIVDDASKKFNKMEVENFINSNNTNKIKYFIKENAANVGIVKNYNYCINKANGKYIFYLCMDDVLYDNRVIEDVVDYFNKNNIDIFMGYVDFYDENLKKYVRTYPNESVAKKIKDYDAKQMLELMMYRNVFMGACTPFRKRIINKIGMLDERFTLLEDYPRYIKILEQGITIKLMDRKLIKYRMGGVTTSKKENPILEADMDKIKKLYIKDYDKREEKQFSYFGKVQIGWCTSQGFLDSYKYLEEKINYSIELLIDSNEKKRGTVIESKKVYAPEDLLLKIHKEKFFIWIFSDTYYFDIRKLLQEYGLEEFVDFAEGMKDYIMLHEKNFI